MYTSVEKLLVKWSRVLTYSVKGHCLGYILEREPRRRDQFGIDFLDPIGNDHPLFSTVSPSVLREEKGKRVSDEAPHHGVTSGRSLHGSPVSDSTKGEWCFSIVRTDA